MRVEIKDYEALSRDELYRALHLRDLVFVVGQKITAEPEVDGRDPLCEHALMYDEDGLLVATARIFHREAPMIVGRVAVHPDRQGQGLGTILMEHVQAHLGAGAAELHAQAHLERWYTRLGWRRFGDVFEEAEIAHVMMRWPGIDKV
ncbi:MAG: GNAT family N-acetyltransferase [Bradymonadaceae bacterium]|nr:GNAT family N-acetyltransferase [Lujinxingiaceae bacterium]